MLVQSGDRTGGAAAATDLEQMVVAESAEILEGPRAERAAFSAVSGILGFEYDEASQIAQKSLRDDIFFRQIEVAHEDEPVTEDRVYLYFWPGGQTERAAIQIQKTKGTDVSEKDIITIRVSPLTGKTEILGGPIAMLRPRTDEDASERSDF
jgi:general secretion pathway protein H